MSQIDRVKRDIPILDVLDYIGVHAAFRSGWQSIKCPFHNDRTASAAVHPTAGRFKCHACDARGDVIDLAKLYLGTHDIREAISWLTRTFTDTP